jgi:hypothetical protein
MAAEVPELISFEIPGTVVELIVLPGIPNTGISQAALVLPVVPLQEMKLLEIIPDHDA